MKRKIFFTAFGLVLVTIWGICFLGNGISDSYTAAMGLSFTFIGVYLLQKEYDFNLSVRDKAALVFFPLLYVISLYYVLFDNGYFTSKKYNLYQTLFYFHLINPLNIAFIGMLLGLTKLKDLTKPVNIFIFTYIVLFYSYMFHPNWMAFWLGTQVNSFDTELPRGAASHEDSGLIVKDDIDLAGFLFINSDLDTITLTKKSDKYILLETWSENCLPCIKAMKELPDFYQMIQEKVEVYYVYENKKESVRKKFDKIFNFKSIHDKSRILIDINQEMYNSLGMQGFPYFSLFDPEGRLIFLKRGYHGKKTLSGDIISHIQ